jgi:Do/DeqQ family serine protease
MSDRVFRRRLTLLLAALLGAAALALTLAPRATQAILPVTPDGQPVASLAPMLEKVVPAVVNINSKTRVRVRNPFVDDPLFRQFFGMQNAPRERIEQSLGSGVIIDAAKGYVLTNNHVIEGADDISVTLHDNRTLHGRIVGSDPQSDVAVIQIPAENLTALPLADSTQLRVGDFVAAVGNPFGLGQTVTHGIVSALQRSGLRGLGYQNFIQTDAPINPGNSGGALVNLRGELVGINSAIYTPSGGNVGIGFAIPSNLAVDAMRQLIASGHVLHGSLGVQAQTVTPDIAQLLQTSQQHGAVVTDVQPGSPAEAAGLRAGDIITAIDGRTVNSDEDLYSIEGAAKIGAPLELRVIRDGKPVTVHARLAAEQFSSSDGGRLDVRLSGAELASAGERTRREGLNGVSVVRVAANSRAAKNDLRPGDLIVAVNQVEIDGFDDLKKLLARQPRELKLAVVRARNLTFLSMQ